LASRRNRLSPGRNGKEHRHSTHQRCGMVRAMLPRPLEVLGGDRSNLRPDGHGDEWQNGGSRPMLRDDVTHVLTRAGASADDLAAAVAAIDSGHPRVIALVQAERPATPAAIAAFDGFVRVEEAAILLSAEPVDGAVELETPHGWTAPGGAAPCSAAGYERVILRYAAGGREVRVGDGAAVVAGQPLTAGDIDLHDVLVVFGVAEVRTRMIAQMVGCGLSESVAAVLVEPMFTLLRIAEPGDSGLEPGVLVRDDAWHGLLGESLQRCLRAEGQTRAPLPAELAVLLDLAPEEAFVRWSQGPPFAAYPDLTRPSFPVSERTLTGYPALARHPDP
jgi:hypothetical protein